MGLFSNRQAAPVNRDPHEALRIAQGGRDLPIWPSGIARVSDGILEVTTGDGIRVAVRDIKEIGIEPPRAGRLSLTLRYAAGLDKVKCSYWVEAEHEAALNALVDRVRATSPTA